MACSSGGKVSGGRTFFQLGKSLHFRYGEFRHSRGTGMGVRSVVRRWLICRLAQDAVLRSNFSQADQFRRIGI